MIIDSIWKIAFSHGMCLLRFLLLPMCVRNFWHFDCHLLRNSTHRKEWSDYIRYFGVRDRLAEGAVIRWCVITNRKLFIVENGMRERGKKLNLKQDDIKV